MANVIIQALGATFIDRGTHKLVQVGMRAPVLLRRKMSIYSQTGAMQVMDDAQRALAERRIPYTLTLRLAPGERAPRGFKVWPLAATRRDEDFSTPAAAALLAQLEEQCQACIAAGWQHYVDSDALEALCGERDGIAHAATIEGRENHNDSVFETWAACYAEVIAP